MGLAFRTRTSGRKFGTGAAVWQLLVTVPQNDTLADALDEERRVIAEALRKQMQHLAGGERTRSQTASLSEAGSVRR